MELHNIIKYPLSTEKSLRIMESENKLIFVVDRKATAKEIKHAVEDLFKGKVVAVTTLVNTAGKKQAYVKFDQDTPAIDIATQLGLM